MSKWYGRVGYISTIEVEDEPGVWEPTVVERQYYGDLLKTISKWSMNTNSSNDDLGFSNQISIVADPYAYQHFSSIKYVEFMDALWSVTSAELQYPRIILTVGGVWNGQTVESTDEI